MGTKPDKELTKEYQLQIKDCIAQLGISQKEFAKFVFYELNDTDNEAEIEAFAEKMKKQLQRDTTKPETLKEYINIIPRLPGYEKLGVVIPVYNKPSFFSEEFSSRMKAISEELSDEISKSEKEAFETE